MKIKIKIKKIKMPAQAKNTGGGSLPPAGIFGIFDITRRNNVNLYLAGFI